MKKIILKAAFVGATLLTSTWASAALITHNADEFTNTFTSPFGVLADPVGEFFIDSGVNYSFGNVEGVFTDPPAALCGINVMGECDLLTAVDAQIVALGTTNQGFTSFVSVTAGGSSANTLLLEVFNDSMDLLGSATNVNGGVDTFSVDLSNVFEIAFFRVSGDDTWGLQTVSIETPVSDGHVDVSTPATLAIFSLGVFGLAARRFKK